jgi:Family of unknown function (DUF6600)
MRKLSFTLVGLFGLMIALTLFAPSRAAAQGDQGGPGDGDDPPSRVARLSYAQGAVSFQPAGTDDWIDASINRPVTTGDKLWSDSGSRAALHIGSASINLSQNTGFSFLNLTDNVAQLQLTAGTLRIRVKRLGDNENFEVDTPNLAFSILRPGIYKISVNDTGDNTTIEDRSGEGEVTGGGSAFTLHAGDLGTFAGTDQLSADVENIGDDEDDFDHWSEQRDHHEDVSISARYVSDDAIGYDDLDDNGDWRPVPDYGNVWFPRAAVTGWAPYHYGHWAYVAPWGYTWVDDASWGFAPFHYGRWVSVNGAWGWIPCPPRPAAAVYGGPVYVRPVYAPALVAWVGGPHFGVALGAGGGGFAAGVNVGWFPLGPREVFVPSYPVSRGYVNNVNVSNTTVTTTVVNNYYNTVVVNKTVNVTNVTYVNQRVPGAVVATSPQAFSSGQPVAKNFAKFDAREVASAPVAAQTPAAVPQREAVLGGRAAASKRPPAAVESRAIVAKTAPPPPPPSFAQRQEAIKSNGGRPISIAAARKITPVRTASSAPAPQVKVAPPAKPTQIARGNKNPSQPANASNGNRPANQQPPANSNRPGQPAANAPQNNNNRPGQPAANAEQKNENRPGQPAVNNSPNNNNRPPAQQPAANNPAANNNQQRPPAAHPANEQLEQQHQQQNADLQKKQAQERQQVEQQHQAENQQLEKQKADAATQQRTQQQHQQQLEALQKQHQQQQQQLQQKQEQERTQAQKQPPPKDKDNKQQKDKDKDKPKDDRPPQNNR